MPQGRVMGPKFANLAKPLRSVAGAAAEVARAGVADLAGDNQDSRVRGFLKALGGAAALRADSDARGAGHLVPAEPAKSITENAGQAVGSSNLTGPIGDNEAEADVVARPRRLVDRLTTASKS
jgi:hypothetical protein